MIVKILFSIFLLWISVHDIKTHRIENFVHFIIMAAAFFLTEITIAERIAGLIICFLPIGTVSFTTGKIGMGDAKLSAVFGFVIGAYTGLMCLITGLLLSAVITGIYSVIKRIKEKKPIALAPYLCAGFLLFLFFN